MRYSAYRRKMVFYGVWIGLFLAGCESIDLEAPTPAPTWFYTAPTLAPTRPPLDARPTESRPFNPAAPLPGQNNPIAAGLPADSPLPPLGVEQLIPGALTVQITLSNGALVLGVLFENPSIEIEGVTLPARYPGVILLGASPDAWGDFPANLRDEGYTVLVIDMGTTTNTQDFVEVFHSLQERSTVDPGAMGVIAVGGSADFVLTACAALVGCDVAALINPQITASAEEAIFVYNPRPLYLAASANQESAYNAVQTLSSIATGDVRVELPLNAGSGLEILATAPRVPEGIFDFLGDYLIPSPLPLDDGE